MAGLMTRRAFLTCPHRALPSAQDARPSPAIPTPLATPDLYLEAMRCGIDPAAVAPGDLRARVAAATGDRNGAARPTG